MRLGTCIAVEAVIGVAMLGGATAGVVYGLNAIDPPARSVAAAPPVPVAAPVAAAVAAPAPVAAAAPAVAAVPAPVAAAVPAPVADPEPNWTVFPGTDDELLAPLREAAVTGTKINRGGNTLSLRLDFASGGRAAFKPEQVKVTSTPRREVAAFRIDRFLHIGRVAPSIGRSFPVADLVAGFPDNVRSFGANRVDTDGIAHDGMLAGSVSWWIPDIAVPKIHGFDIDENDGVVSWKRLVKAGATIADDDRWIAEQVSTMTLFDFLIDNIDRWTGGNIRTAPGGKQIFFMDNTFSFTSDPYGHRKGQGYLHRVEVFSRDLVSRIRAMTEDDLQRILEPDKGPFEHILTDREIHAVIARRDFAIAYIDSLIAKYGEDTVLAFP